MHGPTEDNPLRLVYLTEVCRLADRLERYNLVINGQTAEFFEVEQGDDGVIIIRVDKVVGEARMTFSLFRLAADKLMDLDASRAPVPPPVEKPEDLDPVDEITARYERRKREASGA